MPSSIPSAPAATIWPTWRGCARKAARRSFNCATSSAKPAPWSTRARAIKQALAPFNVPLVINDRIDVALAAGADGVHVGQDDMAVEDARKLLGRGAIIGLSIKTVAEAQAAPVDLIDYVGSGGVYVTRLEAAEECADRPRRFGARSSPRCMRRAPRLPVCGIAGIDASNAAAVIAAGADGVAVISALSLAPDPAAAARGLRAIVDAALAKRGA